MNRIENDSKGFICYTYQKISNKNSCLQENIYVSKNFHLK